MVSTTGTTGLHSLSISSIKFQFNSIGATRPPGDMTCKEAGTHTHLGLWRHVSFSSYSNRSRQDHHSSRSVLICSLLNYQKCNLEVLVRFSTSLFVPVLSLLSKSVPSESLGVRIIASKPQVYMTAKQMQW